MPDYKIEVYNPCIEIDNAILAHAILWWPFIAFLFIYASEQSRFGCKCIKNYLVKYTKIMCLCSDGRKYDTGLIKPNSCTVEPIKEECKCDGKNNQWYLMMLLALVFISFFIPFYGYWVSSAYYILHIAMLTWCCIWFMGIILFKKRY